MKNRAKKGTIAEIVQLIWVFMKRDFANSGRSIELIKIVILPDLAESAKIYHQ